MNDYSSIINWYPGHMAKTKRLLQDQIKKIDLIIEICDARVPLASRNPDLLKLISGKRSILFLNKSDMSDPVLNKAWIHYFQDQGIDAHLTDAVKIRSKEAIHLIENATKEIVESAQNKGIRKTVRAMIVGIPNVGKSTLINHIHGKSITKIGDKPGITRSNQWVKISPYLEILDTPGLLWPKLEDQDSARKLCYIGSVNDEILDLSDLTICLLEDLCKIVPDRIKERYHISDTDVKGVELLDEVCRGRGWLLKGGQFDYERCYSIVMDEYRAGKLGRITWEHPPETK